MYFDIRLILQVLVFPPPRSFLHLGPKLLFSVPFNQIIISIAFSRAHITCHVLSPHHEWRAKVNRTRPPLHLPLLVTALGGPPPSDHIHHTHYCARKEKSKRPASIKVLFDLSNLPMSIGSYWYSFEKFPLQQWTYQKWAAPKHILPGINYWPTCLDVVSNHICLIHKNGFPTYF